MECCNFENGEKDPTRDGMGGEVSGRQIEQLVDELILFANIVGADPPSLWDSNPGPSD
jgi:hypothetical protein